MHALKRPDEDDKRAIVQMVDAALLSTSEDCARVTMVIQHEFDENPLPYLLDYLEFRGCRVESLFTTPRLPGHIQRELIIRHGSARHPWDGSVE